MRGEVFVVVTAPAGWAWSHGIDMLTSRTFKDEPVGFTMDGWTITSRSPARATADHAREQARSYGRDSIVLVFDELSDADRRLQ